METQIPENPVEIRLDETRRVLLIEGKVLRLGPREYQVFNVLWGNQNRVLSRQQILDMVDTQIKIFDRTIDSVISHIRKKLRRFQACAVEIRGVYGKGYRLTWRKQAPPKIPPI